MPLPDPLLVPAIYRTRRGQLVSVERGADLRFPFCSRVGDEGETYDARGFVFGPEDPLPDDLAELAFPVTPHAPAPADVVALLEAEYDEAKQALQEATQRARSALDNLALAMSPFKIGDLVQLRGERFKTALKVVGFNVDHGQLSLLLQIDRDNAPQGGHDLVVGPGRSWKLSDLIPVQPPTPPTDATPVS